MPKIVSRRKFVTMSTLAIPIAAAAMEARSVTAKTEAPKTEPAVPGDTFPTQSPELVQEMVRVSHFDLKRVKELVSDRPSLARAAWDWGFGDWECALGAASHMGNRPIAEYLIANGARPSIFSATMLGQLEVVKAFVAAQPGIQRIAGPHSISLLAHAKAGGEAARPVYDFLQALGDADRAPEAPLSDRDRAAILGTYTFGPGPTQRVDITVERGYLTWTRKGTMGRWLLHVGDRVFYPCGAAAARIKFADDNGAIVMTVSDPDVVLMAKRS